MNRLLKRLLPGSAFKLAHHPGDPGRATQEAIDRFRADPDNPFLVSFPRTGSHWLRMMIELYFERPLLVRSFFNFSHENYLLLHTHDMNLTEQPQNVIYLYRNPVDTIYSMLQHQEENIHDHNRITHWSNLYGRHLDKWLHREEFTRHKTVITYEGLKHEWAAEFAKVTQHFGQSLNLDRLAQAADQVTKKRVKQKAVGNPRIVQWGPNYEQERQVFRDRYAEFVWEVLTKNRTHLFNDFSPENSNES